MKTPHTFVWEPFPQKVHWILRERYTEKCALCGQGKYDTIHNVTGRKQPLPKPDLPGPHWRKV